MIYNKIVLLCGDLISLIEISKMILERGVGSILLGLISPSDIEKVSMEYYQKLGLYISKDFIDHGLFGWERVVFSEYLSTHSTILVLGAGGGREINILLKLGHFVYASEPVQTYIDYIKDNFQSHQDSLVIIQTAPSYVPRLSKKMDAVLFGWTMYSHIPQRSRRINLLADAGRMMKRDGKIIVSYLLAPTHVSRSKKYFHIFSEAIARSIGNREPELGDTIRFSSKGAIFLHFFTRNELEEEFRLAGLKPVYWGREGYAVLLKMIQ